MPATARGSRGRSPASGPSGRTPLFRTITRLLGEARFLNRAERHRGLASELPELGAAVRSGDPVARREFLALAARLGIALPLAGSMLRGRAVAAVGRALAGADPIGIVGAGAAGLTAAYRLLQGNQPCELFEASNRAGGRIFTRKNFNKEGQFCELGAELVDSNHADLIALAGELGLAIQELKTGDAGVELFHFGGKVRTEQDLLPAFQELAAAIAADQEQLYTEEEDWTDHARELDKVSLRNYLDGLKSKAEPWILELLNVAYTGEYGLDSDQQTALNLLTYLDPDTSEGFKIFGDSDESKRVQGGNSELTAALEKKVQGQAPLHLGMQLVKIADDGSALALTFKSGASTTTRKFARVILAIPFTILREVEGIAALPLSPQKKKCVQELGYGTNVKVMYGFSEKPWRKPANGRPECNGSIYTALSSQCFWETSRAQGGASGILTNSRGGAQGLRTVDDDLHRETLGNLDQIVPGSAAKHDPTLRSTFLWPTYPFTKASYSCPLVGQMTTVWDAKAEQELGGRLLFAGEHTSDEFGGFMNGAIESGNRVAREILAPK